MDDWLDGRRDVDLDGDCSSGSGPAGRRDWQAVKKIVGGGAPLFDGLWLESDEDSIIQILHDFLRCPQIPHHPLA